jgi:HprK-related kinase A
LKISDLSPSELAHRLRVGELLLHISPFTARIRSDIASLAGHIATMYGDFPIKSPTDFADFDVEVARPKGLRRWLRPQAFFYFDGIPSFKPLPLDQAYPMLEWGLNWCIGAHAHQFLVFHAAVIERNGKTAILPAPPGSGKSTLCAGLVGRGWRLLSDELALLDMDTLALVPLSRPINLKNESINVIRQFQPDAVMTAPVQDTAKGTVALVRPPEDSVRRVGEPGIPAWIIFPRYCAGAEAAFVPFSKAHTVLKLAEQSFNYDLHGRRGFEAVTRLVDRCRCFDFGYGDLHQADHAFANLMSANA